MTTFHLKLLAIITMIIDHVGLFFFPQFIWLRMIGRIAFPLFAWMIANGARHTHDEKAYLLRLILFAVVSQIPFLLANRLIDPHFFELNVLFTLSLGLAAIIMTRSTKNYAYWILSTVFFATIAQLVHADYGFMGVVSIVLFYIFFKNKKAMVISQGILFLFPFLFFLGYHGGDIEPLGLFALFFIVMYNGKKGVKAKYLFYVFYPIQYIAFYIVLQRLL